MSDQNNTPTHLEGELMFQMQAMTQMMERMNFVMGNMCDRLDRVEKRSNKAGPSTQDVRKHGAEPKANNGSRFERPRWADYEDFEEAVDDIGDGGFEDEGHADLGGDFYAIKLKISSFQGKNDPIFGVGEKGGLDF